MTLYTSLIIKDGYCVKMGNGSLYESEIYSRKPIEVARSYEENGSEFIHFVNLEGVMRHQLLNKELVKEIIQSVNIPIQFGGGIVSLKEMDEIINYGANRVIIGAKAVENQAIVKDAIYSFGDERIVVSIYVRNGIVMLNDGLENSTFNTILFGMKMKESGVKYIEYTELDRYGHITVPNMEALNEFSRITGLNIILSGNFREAKDFERLNGYDVSGVVIRDPVYNKLNINYINTILK